MPSVYSQSTAGGGSQLLLLTGALCFGLAVAILAAQLMRVMLRDPSHRNLTGWQGERLEALCRGNAVFNRLEPYVLELSRLRCVALIARAWRVQSRLDTGLSPLPWRPEELVAVWFVSGILLGVVIIAALHNLLSPLASLLLLMSVVAGYVFHQKRKLDQGAVRRLTLLQQRLPYTVDLMALMMEAGAGFKESFATVVEETRGQPLGEEFGKVLKEMECGQTLAVAMQRLATRLRVEDISEVILAIQTADELGTPLSETFLDLAERMRNKRSLWAEKRAGEAKASITFPGIVIMVACLVIVVAPFVLQAVYEAQVF